MKIIKVDTHFQSCEAISVACIGYFDGLHLGHMTLIDKVKEVANKHHCLKACICFDNDPWVLLNKTEDNKHLTPLSTRLTMLKEKGMDLCYLLHFDEEMMNLSIPKFKHLLESLNLKALVCGDDFHFSKKGAGCVNDLMNDVFEVHVLTLKQLNGSKISSSLIEKQIKEGNVSEANNALGYDYTLSGSVIHGNNVGHTKLGFPTVNLGISEAFVLPKIGVYVGSVTHNEITYKAMVNVGFNPTINEKKEISIEAYMLDFDQMIYGEKIKIAFIDYIRDEQKFQSMDALIHQLQNDVSYVRNYKRK